METLTVAQMRILDENSAWFGVSAMQLMESAGKAVAAEANKLGESFVVVCGPGNNGGDGFSASRHLKSRPKVFYLHRPKTQEAYENVLRARNYKPFSITPETIKALDKAIRESDVIIDAIFGTGVKAPVIDPAKSVIQMINRSKKAVVSVDVPSGMDPDTGEIADIAVKPTVTVALHAAKKGVSRSGAAGKIVTAPIGIPEKAYTHIGKGDFKFGFPKRADDSHKGDSGRVLVVGGSKSYTGAPYFTAMAALRAGCDLSYVAAPKGASEKIAAMGPDLITYPLSFFDEIHTDDVKEILSKRFDVLCIGNGMGDKKSTLDAAAEIIAETSKPMVIDADGLKAAKPLLEDLGKNVILTPHAGEFEALFGLEPTEANLRKAAGRYKPVILLKGHVDMIAQGNKMKYNDSGNAYMAKGGTGDVLAGLCAGFMAQGVDPFMSASFAALVNGVAGDLAYADESIALTASDLLSKVGKAEKMLFE